MNKFLIKIILLFFCNTSMQSQTVVHIADTENGVGILKEKATELFAIVPKHILKSKNSSIKVTGESKITSTAKTEIAYSNDIAVIKIISGGKQTYENWFVEPNLHSIIEDVSEGYLETRLADGSIKSIHCYIIEKGTEQIKIVPKNSKDDISKGFSGSILFANYKENKVMLGMLLLVEAVNNIGLVMPINVVYNTIKSFFPYDNRNDTENINILDTKLTKLWLRLIDDEVIDNSKFYVKFISKHLINKNVKNEILNISLVDSKIQFTADTQLLFSGLGTERKTPYMVKGTFDKSTNKFEVVEIKDVSQSNTYYAKVPVKYY